MAKRSAFDPTMYEADKGIVKLDTVADAKESIRVLREMFDSAETDAHKLRIARMANLAANRAEIMTKNPNYSSAARDSKKPIEKLYRDAAEKMFGEVRCVKDPVECNPKRLYRRKK